MYNKIIEKYLTDSGFDIIERIEEYKDDTDEIVVYNYFVKKVDICTFISFDDIGDNKLAVWTSDDTNDGDLPETTWYFVKEVTVINDRMVDGSYRETEYDILDLVGYGDINCDYKNDTKFNIHDPNKNGVSINVIGYDDIELAREVSISIATRIKDKYNGKGIKYLASSTVDIKSNDIELVQVDKYKEIYSMVNIINKSNSDDNKPLDIIIVELNTDRSDHLSNVVEYHTSTKRLKDVFDISKSINVSIILLVNHQSELSTNRLAGSIPNLTPYMTSVFLANSGMVVNKDNDLISINLFTSINMDKVKYIVSNNSIYINE